MSDSESEDYNDLELNSDDGYDTDSDDEEDTPDEKNERLENSEELLNTHVEESVELEETPDEIEDVIKVVSKKIKLNRKDNKFVGIIENYSRLPTSSIIHGVRLSRFALLDKGAEPLVDVACDLKSLREVNLHMLSIVDKEILTGVCPIYVQDQFTNDIIPFSAYNQIDVAKWINDQNELAKD